MQICPESTSRVISQACGMCSRASNPKSEGPLPNAYFVGRDRALRMGCGWFETQTVTAARRGMSCGCGKSNWKVRAPAGMAVHTKGVPRGKRRTTVPAILSCQPCFSESGNPEEAQEQNDNGKGGGQASDQRNRESERLTI